MSKLAEFKALEAQLAAQLKQLDALKNDDKLKRESPRLLWRPFRLSQAAMA